MKLQDREAGAGPRMKALALGAALLLLAGCRASEDMLRYSVSRPPLSCPDPEQEQRERLQLESGLAISSETMEVCQWRAKKIEEGRAEARKKLHDRTTLDPIHQRDVVDRSDL